MIIIEAGGSSTQACQLLDGSPSSIKNYDAISPSYMNRDEIIEVLDKILKVQKPDNELYFYGTGCRQASAKAIIKECIQKIHPYSKIEIASDLLAAAKVTANKSTGQINILGTGAASCLYKEEQIKEVYFNSGYLFGDYGSGFQLGQTFLRAYFEDRLSPETESGIQDFSGVSKQELVQKIYRSETPKQQVANFARCMYRIKQDKEVNNILKDSFTKFIRHQIQLNQEFKNTPQYFVGSIAHFFKDELSDQMEAEGLKITDICRSPIEKLIEYHLT